MKDLRFAKFVLLVNSLVPAAILLWDVWHGHAGANPINYAIRTTGLLALIFLSLTLLVTPLRKLTGLGWLFHFRRPLGLLAFFHALAHFSIFFVFDRALSVRDTLSEMVKRPYLVVGSLGLLAMTPLAITSTNAMIKRMGAARWRALHRLAYVAAIAGVVHFYMQVKSDTRLPIAFGIIIGFLLAYRLGAYLATRTIKPAGPNAVSAQTPLDQGRWTGQLRVQKIVQETPEVRTFRLVSAHDSQLPFMHLPGQYLTFSPPVDGKTVKRTYTIASSPARRDYCEVTIKREENGLFSRHMHDSVKEGDIIPVAAAAGRFTFTGSEAESIALLAGGVGITPLMSILRYLTDQNWAGQIYLIFCCKTEKDIIFREEIQSLQRRFPNFHPTITLTRADGANWSGPVGRLSADLLARQIPNLTDIPFYLCGPAEMLMSTRELLRQLAVPESHIHTESFGARRSDTHSAASANGATFAVTFSRSNKTARIDPARPILELADELEVGVESECRSGICGTCKCQLLSGSVQMETQEALDNSDRRNNIILLCQARALEDVTVNA
jgi:ferredoxin-NADP reductase/DMSO/TMAO reductase YedYZ heme-binding membrane subunit